MFCLCSLRAYLSIFSMRLHIRPEGINIESTFRRQLWEITKLDTLFDAVFDFWITEFADVYNHSIKLRQRT